jgi:hypothetical protein
MTLVAKGHGATVDVESQHYKGTQFVIRLS